MERRVGSYTGASRQKAPGWLEVTCPWGNVFNCVASASAAELQAKCTSLGSHPGDQAKGVSFSKVEVFCPVGTASSIARFYSRMLGAETSCAGGMATVHCGPLTALHFVESTSCAELRPWSKNVERDQWHIAIYLHDFEGTLTRLSKAGLIWDKGAATVRVGTAEDAAKQQQFRFKDIQDPAGNIIMEIEHEVRSLSHKDCPLFADAL